MITDSSTVVDDSTREPSFRLKGGLFPMTLLDLSSHDAEQLRHDLSIKVAEAPAFFQQAPAVISFEQLELESDSIDLGLTIKLCLEFGLIIVALKGGSEKLQAQALELNLALMPAARTKAVDKDKIQTTEPTQVSSTELEIATNETANTISDSAQQQELPLTSVATPEAPVPETSPSAPDELSEAPESAPTAACKIISTPVRSGQQIYAAGGDLIVLAPVSAGAELLADGNIHVYGALRGRALAGVKGNTDARVFCHSQEAELISIAGCFMVDEDLRSDHWKQAVQILLQDEKLHIKTLT